MVAAGANAWAILAVVAPAFGQEPATPTFGRPLGGVASPSGQTGSGLGGGGGDAASGLRLPPGLVGNGGTGSSAAAQQEATFGSAPRAGLRAKRGRRARQPTVVPVRTGFRPTLAPATVAAEVQPVQTGVPDAPEAALVARKRPVATDPYEPLGVRVGNVVLRPVVGQSIGYDTNPNRTQTQRRGSFVSLSEAELGVQSDWSRHELTGFLRGAYYDYPSNKEANRPEGSGRIGLRLDATRDTQLDVEGHYQVDTQRPGSPDLNAAVRERPLTFTEGGSAGVTHRFNRLIVSLRGSIDRADFDDAELTNGTRLSQADRNLTSYGTSLRVGYEVKPGFVPFGQAFVDRREYDQKVDSAGFARSSDGVGAKVGTTFELTRLVTGEVSAGFVDRSYKDPRLRDLVAPVAEGALSYALTPLTTVRATVSATVDETTIPNANGIQSVKGSVEVSHDLRRNLTVTAGLTAGNYAYQGVRIDEQSFGATLRADYRITRQIALRASYVHDQLKSSVSGSSYSTDVFLVGLRLQP